MPVTGCTWRSSPNVLGCWDRGEPRRPVRVGHSHPTAGSLFPWSRSCLPLLGRFWRLCGARRSWLDVGAGGVGAPVAWDPRAPRKVQRPGASCACGDISARPGTGDAAGDGIAVPDGVECPRPEGRAPSRAECPRCRREPDGYGCSVWPGPDSGAQARVSRTPRRCCYFLRRSPRLEPEVVWSSWRRGWVEGRGLEGCRVVALIHSAGSWRRIWASHPGGRPFPRPGPF